MTVGSEPNCQQDPESVFYVHAGTGWGSFPEVAPPSAPAAKIYVGSFREKETDGYSRGGSDPAWVRVEVAKELLKGDPLTLGNFDQVWGALVRTGRRAPPRAPCFGSPWPCEEEVSPRQWLERAGFAVFLRAVGAAERGVAVPGTPEELRRRCGVVAVEDDGFCGFWCLAYLLGVDLPKALEKVTIELESLRHNAQEARLAGRHPSAEDRAWERLWNIADAKLRCLRYRGSHVDLVSCELQRRGNQDTNCFLTHSELSLLCARLCGKWTPVVEVTPDFHASEETGDHSMLALAAEGVPSLEAVFPDNQDESAEALRDAGWRLHEEGYRLITAEPVSEGRPSNRAAPDFEDLRQMRPLIIHLGTHYFLLDSTEDVPEPLSMEEVNYGANRGFFERCGRCFTKCFDRWWNGNSFANEARAPLRRDGQ